MIKLPLLLVSLSLFCLSFANAATINNVTYQGRGVSQTMKQNILNLTLYYSNLMNGPSAQSFWGISHWMNMDLQKMYGNRWSIFDGYINQGGLYYTPLNDTVLAYTVSSNSFFPLTTFYVWLSGYKNSTSLKHSPVLGNMFLSQLLSNSYKVTQLGASLDRIYFVGSGVNNTAMQDKLANIAVNQATLNNLNAYNSICGSCYSTAQNIALNCQNVYGGNWTSYVVLPRGGGDGTIPVYDEIYLSLYLDSNGQSFFVVMGRSN